MAKHTKVTDIKYRVGTFELEESIKPIVYKQRFCRSCGIRLQPNRYMKCVSCLPTLPYEQEETQIHT